MTVTDLPLVSIVIPVYNGANYMAQAIDSALSQTYRNVEILVINDGSKDNGASRDIALSYGERIRYFDKPNGGVSSALNLGLKEMKGDFFAWLSHDDYYDPARIEGDVNTIIVNNAKAAFTDVITVDEFDKELSRSNWDNRIHSPLIAMENNGMHFSSITIAKEFILKYGGFDEKNKTTQDVQLTLLVLKDVDFYKNPTAYTYIRMHEVNRSRHTNIYDFQKDDLFYLGEKIHESMDLFDFSRHLDFSKDKMARSKAALAYADFFYFTRNKSFFYEQLRLALKYLPVMPFSSAFYTQILKFAKRYSIDSYKLN